MAECSLFFSPALGMPSTCIGRRLETIFCYPPQVATNGETASISGRGSPEMALAAPPEQGQEYYLQRFCEETWEGT